MNNTTKQFDLIIIGGGAGAFAAAIRANELGARTALINAGLPLGGTCVNVGCVPSKALLWAGETLHHAKHHNIPGIELEVKNFDFQKVVQDELALVEKLRQEKYEKVLKNLEYVTLIEGKAKFVSEDEVEIISAQNPAPEQSSVRGKKFIIATGSTANVPPIEGIREVGFVTHIEALKMDKQPKELVIIGAGAVGLEFAQMYARFGTKVIVLQRGPSILPQVEKPLADRLMEVLQKEGVTIITNATITKAYKEGNPSTSLGAGKKVVEYKQGDGVSPKLYEAKADEILLATGKTANTEALNLGSVGVEVNDRKSVVVNETLQTLRRGSGQANPNIYAVGDVTNAPARYETTAGREGTLAAENILRGTTLSIDYDTVPFTVFTDPQIAGVGTSESRQIKEQGVCNCRTISFEMVPKAIVMHRTEGLIHMAVDTKSPPSIGLGAGKIVGMQILAPNAGELIATGMMIVKNGNTLDDVVNSLPMFPTLSEAIKIAALSFTKDITKLSCCI